MGRRSSSWLVLWTILLAAAPLLASGADDGDVQFGLNMITKAGKGVCRVEKLYKTHPIDDQGVNYPTCDFNMKFREWETEMQIYSDEVKKQGGDPKDYQDMIKSTAMESVKQHFKINLIILIPSTYRSCDGYVDDENAEPARDMSSLLEDSSAGEYPFKALTHCLMDVAEQQNGKDDMAALKSTWVSSDVGDVQFGLNMLTKAGKRVCWIEKVYKKPPIDDEGVNYPTCDKNMKFGEWDSEIKIYSDKIESKGGNVKDNQDMIKSTAMMSLKENFIKRNLIKLMPSAYRSCEEYADDEKAAPVRDLSSLLGGSSAGEYPFKAFAHCLMDVAEQQNGKEDMAGMTWFKSTWVFPKTFHESILDRENANRARHGAPPLTLDPELNTRAQRYAEHLASAQICDTEHMAKSHPDITYKDGLCGENLAAIEYKDGEDMNLGVDAANAWYSEIKDYPWMPAYDGTNARGVIGHFTASVWKSSQLAGYGIARSPGCDMVLIVARYYPEGNLKSPCMPYYKENVLPPQ